MGWVSCVWNVNEAHGVQFNVVTSITHDTVRININT